MAEDRVQRRLAAIVAADIVGYSRMMEADEAGTLAHVKALRSEVLYPKVASYGGRIVKTTGDGALIEFPSAVHAVDCCVDVQRALAERNGASPPGERIETRMGINVGDIILDDDDIYGDGVNVAARLEGLAEPGTVYISSAVYEQVNGKLDLAFEDMGEHTVKNISRPVRVYRVHVGRASAARPAASLSLPDRPSIAVLPFQNMSGDPEQDYFCDGTVDDIITGLSRIKWLSVIARNSTFTYKGKAVDVRQVGRDLEVRYVLEGSVRKAGNRIRITGQLIEATTGAHIWADRYDRPLDDIFAVQDEITLSVVAAIEPSLRLAETERIKRKRPESLGAYDLVLRAMPQVTGVTAELAREALPMLEQALALEPDYGLAQALAAWCHQTQFIRGSHSEEERESAIRHAIAAVASGGDDATALAISAFVFAMSRRDMPGARELFDRALSISPSNIFALGYGAIILAVGGEFDRAIERAEYALRLSPFDPLIVAPLDALAIAHFGRGDYEASLSAARRSVQARPHFPQCRLYLIAALVRLGRVEEAKREAQSLLVIQPSFAIRSWSPIRLETSLADPFSDAFRAAGLPE